MSLRIQVTHDQQQQEFEHAGGPLEFGRGPQRESKRCFIEDMGVSRDQLRIEELPGGRVRAENLSQRIAAEVAGQGPLDIRQTREIALPLQLLVGKTQIHIATAASSPAPSCAVVETIADIGRGDADTLTSLPATVETAGESEDTLAGLVAIPAPPRRPGQRRAALVLDTGSVQTDDKTERLADWLQTIIELQQTPPASPTFYEQTAQALASLVALDLGLVLLRQGDGWKVVAAATASDEIAVQYSRTLVGHVARQRQTFYQDIADLGPSTASLANIEAAVASPIFGLNDDVVGVLYGSRSTGAIVSRGPIGRIEAQLVQLLAAAVGSNLTRVAALRTRVQFEQFFSPDLVRELERDPNLLEGRSTEVTILFSDLRGFTALSQQLGAQKTFRTIRDMMERLTYWIMEFGGVIVDFAGDGIMAMWNAPTQQPDHAARACRAALAMLGELPGLNDRWAADMPPDQRLALGIGINTGPAQVGNTGSSRKLKYGPHGHSVNLASRVQDATKKLRLPLLITASTRDLLPSTIHVRRLGRVRLPGVAEPTMLYELHGEQAAADWLALRDAYETALTQYESQQWSQACHWLLRIAGGAEEQGLYDGPTLALMRRAWECLETRPQPFEAIIEVTTK